MTKQAWHRTKEELINIHVEKQNHVWLEKFYDGFLPCLRVKSNLCCYSSHKVLLQRCKHTHCTVKNTNTSLLAWIKKAEDLAVETCSVVPIPADMCTHTHTFPLSSSPKALANYYHHRHSKGPPSARFWLTQYTHYRQKPYTVYSI